MGRRRDPLGARAGGAPLEVIVHDDASSDGIADVVRGFGGAIASDSAWGRSTRIAFLLGGRCLGETLPYADRDRAAADLERFGVERYLVWREPSPDSALLAGRPEVTGGTIPGLRIYRVGG